MMTMSSGASLGTDVLRVVFERKGDRYEHRIIYSKPDGSSGILASQEGRPDESWPPSPALQSLNLETRPDGNQTIMLVGMAGRSHWSMSVEADLTQNRLAFDIACRVHEPPVWLGSTYTVTNKQSLVESAGFSIARGLEWGATQGKNCRSNRQFQRQPANSRSRGHGQVSANDSLVLQNRN